MKKADAIKAVIKEIKDQNRSSFSSDDIESFRKKLGRKLTKSLLVDFEVEAVKAGLETPENLDFEDFLPKRIVSAEQRGFGVEPGRQLRTNLTDLPEAEIKRLGVVNPITVDDDGVKIILKNMERTGLGLRGALNNLTRTVDDYHAHLLKNHGKDVANQFTDEFDAMFPDRMRGDINRGLTEHRVYEQLLYEAGYLEDADPPTGKEKIKGKTVFTFKDLDTEFNALPKSERGRRSRQGKKILDIKTKGGVPAVVGRDKDGKLIYHPTKTIPYKLKLSKEGIDYVQDFKLPGHFGTTLPAIPTDAKPIAEQIREDKRKFYESQRIPTGRDVPLANKVTSPRTGITYDNYNAMVSAEGPVQPGGETVEPNRGEASRRARGAVIVRSDVNTFKQAMGKAVSKGGKVNLFTEIVNEARKIDPAVSMDAMQDIKDYLFFTGYLEADKEVSGKLGPSRLSDADVPEYVKPTQKYYNDGLKILDAGGENEPLVIRKLSADPNTDDLRRGARPITGPETATPDKPISERTSRLLGIIKKGGRTGLKVLPYVALADILTSPDPVAAAVGSTPVADATLRGARAREEAARVRERAGPDYKRMRSADEETFSRIAEEEASGRLKGPRGFLYLD